MEKLKPARTEPYNLWDAKELKKLMGYRSQESFMRLIDKVIDVLNIVDIPYFENVIAIPPSTPKGKYTFHLSRFACYLMVCMADSKKEAVHKLQAIIYREFKPYGITRNHIAAMDRFEIRNELADANKLLNKRAAASGVKDYGSFYDSGYLGLYAFDAKELHDYRKVNSNKNLSELMDRAELAANLLRVTLTEESLRVKNIRGQKRVENIHFEVGNSIRKTLHLHLGIYPEQLSLKDGLHEIALELKSAYKNMNLPASTT